jgi:hypothetical protein
MKNNINIINVAGAAVSAGLLFSCFFLPSSNKFSLAKGIRIPEIQEIYTPQRQTNLENSRKIVPIISPTTEISKHINHKKIPRKQIALCDHQEQKPTQQSDIGKESSEPNGCPKGLEYFTMRPRPKPMPEECITCKNLISCVCLTGN